MSAPPIRRAFADLSVGQVHYAECGDASAPAVLLLHQSPRSWTEFREVLPLLGRRYRAIAMDTVGFGDSAPPPWAPGIERWAGALFTFGFAAALLLGIVLAWSILRGGG